MGRGYGVSRSPKVRPSMELVKKLRETDWQEPRTRERGERQGWAVGTGWAAKEPSTTPQGSSALSFQPVLFKQILTRSQIMKSV